MTCAGKMGRVPGKCRTEREHAGCVPGTYQKCAGICRVYAGRACADQLFVRFIDFCGFYSYNVISCA